MSTRDGLTPAIGQLHTGAGKPGIGTGFAVTSRLAVTCAHCVRNRKRVVLRIPRDAENGEELCAASVLEVDEVADLALLELDASLPGHLRPLALLADGREEGSWSSRAWPSQLDRRVDGGLRLSGEVRGLTSDGDRDVLTLYEPALAAKAALEAYGASGAPVLVDMGTVEVAIGVLRRIEPDEEASAVGGLLFAIPAATVLASWSALLPTVNPFKEPLQRFERGDSVRFYGRDHALEHLQAAVDVPANRVVTLFGAPGSGKSSLLRAGLLARRDRDTTIVENYGDADALRAPPGGVLVLDQFDELLREPPALIQAVADRLSVLLEGTAGLTVIIVLRTDHVALFEKPYPALYRLIKEGMRGAEIELDVSRDELIAMCRGPAHAAGITFEGGLAERIVDDLLAPYRPDLGRPDVVRAPPTILPVLGITLWRLAERMGEGRVLRRADYVFGDALTAWADAALASAAEGALNQVLLRLVRIGEEGVPPTREHVARDQLTALSATAAAAVAQLESRGLIRVDEDGIASLMHDTLITGWKRLGGIIVAAAEAVRWKRRSFDGRFLEQARLRGDRLREAEDHMRRTPIAFSEAERDYIAAQRAGARRERAGRIAARMSVVVLLAAIAATIFAFTRRSDIAVTKAVKNASNLEAAGRDLAISDPVQARALLLEAYRQRPEDADGRSALAEAVSMAPGLTATGTGIGMAVMPDLSEIITSGKDLLGRNCADVRRYRGTPAQREYCGGNILGTYAASPGSRYVADVATAARGLRRVAVWRAGEERREWSAPVRGIGRSTGIAIVGSLAVADDGTVVVVGDHGLRIFDGARHHTVAVRGLPERLGSNPAVAISANGRTALVTARTLPKAEFDRPTQRSYVLQKRDGEYVRTRRWAVKSGAIPILAPDGRGAYALGDDVQRFDFARATIRHRARSGIPLSARAFAISPSRKILAISSEQPGIVELGSRGDERTIPIAPADVGADAIAVADNGDVVVYRAAGRWSYYSARATAAVTSLSPALIPDSAVLVSGSGLAAGFRGQGFVGTMNILDFARAHVVAQAPVKAAISQWYWQRDGRLLVALADGTLFTMGADGTHTSLRAPKTPYAIAPSEKIAVVGHGSAVDIIDLTHQGTLRTIKLDAGSLRPSEFSTNGTAVAISGHDRPVMITHPEAASYRVTYGPRPNRPRSPRFKPDPTEAPIVLPSPDGTILAAHSPVEPAIVSLTRDGSTTKVALPSPNVANMAISNTRLAILDDRGVIRIYDVHGRLWLTLAPPPSGSSGSNPFPQSVRFNPAGDELVTGNVLGVRRFKLDPAAWLKSLCANQPSLSADEYRRAGGTGTPKTLCPRGTQ